MAGERKEAVMSRKEFLKRGIVGIVASLALLVVAGCGEGGEEENGEEEDEENGGGGY